MCVCKQLRHVGLMLLVGYVLLAPSAGESCVGAPQWGNCTSGNEGFRNPALDVVDAERLDANSAGLIMDGHLRDWEEHGGSRRYSRPEFATLDGSVVTFEALLAERSWRGPADFSIDSFRLKWDDEWVYLAVEVRDDVWEPLPVGTSCFTAGLQLAFEIGGAEAVDMDGNSALGLVQARRSQEWGISQSVLINLGMSALETECSCTNCADLETASTGGVCCVDYETHYTESMLDAMQVPKRLRAAGRRDEATNITAWEVAIHREDLMYPDWAGREASGASRWQAGTTIGFSFLANEGLEAAVGGVGDDGSAGVLQAGWAGYYPHAMVYGWNAGNKEPWKMGRLRLVDDSGYFSPGTVRGIVPVVTQCSSGGAGGDGGAAETSGALLLDLTQVLELSSDEGLAAALQDGRLVARVSTGPRFGTLTGLTASEDDIDDDAPPVARFYARQVAVTAATLHTSSPDPKCGRCCLIVAELLPGMDACQPPDAPGHPCAECPRAAINAEGAPDAPLGDGGRADNDGASALDASWVPPACTGADCDHGAMEYVILQYRTAIYATAVHIYDTGRKGAVMRVEGVSTPLNSQAHTDPEMSGTPGSPWKLLWEASSEQADNTTLMEQYYSFDEQGRRVFSPPLACESLKLIANLRVFLSAAADEQAAAGVDAVQLVGLARPPPGMLMLADGRAVLGYQPAPGIHPNTLSDESVTLTTLPSCDKNGSSTWPRDLVVHIPAARPQDVRQGSVWGESQFRDLLPFSRAQVQVDMGPVLQHMATLALPGQSIQLVQARLTQKLLPQAATKFYKSADQLAQVIPAEQDLTPVEVEPLGNITLHVDLEDAAAEAILWVRTSIGATYRMLVVLRAKCPQASPIINFEDRRCHTESATSRALVLGATLAITALLLLATVAIIRYFQLRKRLMAIMAEGPRLDLDSPLVKVLDFLGRFEASTGLLLRGPRKAEARELKLAITANMDNLIAPNLRGQLRRNPTLNTAMMRHIMASADGAAASPLQSLDSDSMSGLVEASRAQHSATGHASRQSSTSAASSQRVRLDAIEQVYGRGGERNAPDEAAATTMRPSLGASERLLGDYSAVTVPDSLRGRIARDLFLDAITEQSLLREVECPLAVVVKQSMSVLALEALPQLDAFVQMIEQGYADSGYHCLLHATDVTQRLATLLHLSGISSALSGHQERLQILAAVVSAAIHDYEHPLVSNAFLVANESPVAIGWNDQATLENHSAFKALNMMHSVPAFAFMPDKADRTEFRKTTIAIVLGTDMSRHFDIVTQFTVTIVNNAELANKSSQAKWRLMSDKQRLLVLQVAMKVSDLGHCALPMPQHLAWLERLEEEMFAQGDMERTLGLPISPLCNRRKDSVREGTSQIGFFDLIVRPLVTAWVAVFPECSALRDQMEANYKHWTRRTQLQGKRHSFRAGGQA